MRVIVAGGRDFNNYFYLKKSIDSLKLSDLQIISGGARGADYIGSLYAKNHNLPLHTYPAEWDRYGRSAGYRRNELMASVADAVIAFWDGKSKGTEHMINLMRRLNKKVYVFNY